MNANERAYYDFHGWPEELVTHEKTLADMDRMAVKRRYWRTASANQRTKRRATTQVGRSI